MTEVAADQPEALADFRAAVLAAPAIQAALGTIVDPAAFVPAAVAAARSLGIALDPAAVHAAVRPDPLGLRRYESCAITDDGWPPVGWLPARSVPADGAPAFDWSWFGAAALDEPFFEDSVRRYTPRPFATMFRIRTSLDTLVAGALDEPGVPLHGLIFHMSRCGSTLAAQMLAAVPGHVVLSEPEPVDAVVQWAVESSAPLVEAAAALRAVVAALGRDRSGAGRRLFLKADCWHALQLPLFRAAFPAVPWLFLHRDPAEVMVSQAREPGMHVVPGVLPPGMVGQASEAFVSLEDHGARVLGGICAAVPANWHLGGGMVVDYPDVAAAMLDAIPGHFGFTPDPAERAAMAAARGRSAKDPTRTFDADGPAKRAAVTPAIAAAVERHLAASRRALVSLQR